MQGFSASSHCVMAARSWEWPSAQTTGSSITSCVIGHMHAGRSPIVGACLEARTKRVLLLEEQRGPREGTCPATSVVPSSVEGVYTNCNIIAHPAIPVRSIMGMSSEHINPITRQAGPDNSPLSLGIPTGSSDKISVDAAVTQQDTAELTRRQRARSPPGLGV